jgi:carotenoid 1,2-hydratase
MTSSIISARRRRCGRGASSLAAGGGDADDSGVPTVPLYTPSAANPDGWHHVTSPGGYEWWYFDAEDRQRDLQIVAILFDGFVFHPEYLRRYARYRRRPTRRRPPVPGEYPCAYCAVYRDGRLWGQFMTQYPPGMLDRSSDETVMMGDCAMQRGGDGSIHLQMRGTPWELTARGPKTIEHHTLQARLRFRPSIAAAPVERRFLSRRLSGADHHWIVASPLCDVDGEINFANETVPIGARGYHDHNYGTAPIGTGLRRWIWGRVLFEDEAYTFHLARGRDLRVGNEVHLLHAKRGGIIELPVGKLQCDWQRVSTLGLHYPNELAMDPFLRLTHPRLIDPSPFYLRLTYDAICGGRAGKALCEVAYPHRLRWPILGRMIEMSIDRRNLHLAKR